MVRDVDLAREVLETLATAGLAGPIRLTVQAFMKTRRLSAAELAAFHGGAFARVAGPELPVELADSTG